MPPGLGAKRRMPQRLAAKPQTPQIARSAILLGHRQYDDLVMIDALVPAHGRVGRIGPSVAIIRIVDIVDAASADPHRSMKWR